MVTEREYKHWITKNCDRRNCWIVVAKLGEMIQHQDTTIVGPDGTECETLPLTHDTLEYVYFVDFTEQRLITLVQDHDYYYLIDNTKTTKTELAEKEEKTEHYRSRIVYDTTLVKLVHRLPGSIRKKVGLKHIDKVKLKQHEKKQLQGVVPVDFIGQSHICQVKLFRDFVKQDRKRIDLSGLFILEPKVIEDTAVLGNVKFEHEEVVLYQNNRFHKFAWLKHFSKIKTLTLWYINQVTNDDIDELVKFAPGLEVLEFHYCFQLNGRIMIPVSKLRRLDKFILNNEQCGLQDVAYETVIKDSEWENISNESLTVALIDSYNLTLDFIDLFLKSFKGVTHFIMNDIMLSKLEKNSVNGVKDREEPVSFHSVKDYKVGFKRYRDVKIYDQVRHKCGNAFSDAMLKKIKERSPEKTDAVDMLLNNRPCTDIQKNDVEIGIEDGQNQS